MVKAVLLILVVHNADAELLVRLVLEVRTLYVCAAARVRVAVCMFNQHAFFAAILGSALHLACACASPPARVRLHITSAGTHPPRSTLTSHASHVRFLIKFLAGSLAGGAGEVSKAGFAP